MPYFPFSILIYWFALDSGVYVLWSFEESGFKMHTRILEAKEE